MKRFQWPKERSAAIRHFATLARRTKDKQTFVRDVLRSIVCKTTRAEKDAADDLATLFDQVQGHDEPQDSVDATQRARDLVELGWRLLERGQGDDAITSFRLAFGLAMHQEDAETGMAATAGLVRALVRTQRTEEAEAFVQELRGAAPGAEALDVLLAQIRMSQGRHAEAREILLQVASKVPSAGPALHTDLAICASALGLAAEAEQHARLAAARDPGHAPALVVLFNVLLDSGRVDEAERLLPTLRSVLPRDPYIGTLPRVIAAARAAKAPGGSDTQPS